MKKCSDITSCDYEKVLLFEKNGYQIRECRQCELQFSRLSDVANHLSNSFSDDYFFGGKDGYPDYLKEGSILYKSGLHYAKILSKYIQPGKVLDVGSAAGFILKGFEKGGWKCFGVEPNDTMASYGRSQLNLDIQTCGLEEYSTTENFDLINLIQIIGSFYDLDKAMSTITSLLKKDGLVMVESWDMKSLYARLMGTNWHEYCPPTVIRWFSDKTLSDLFKFYGMELVAKGRPLKRININHGLTLFDYSFPKFLFKKGLIKFFRTAVGKYNVIYPPIDLKWYLFKKVS
jgi:2-polyprenyl-3-methyl-5-hydroxy-6-metoxy-1,4-benzoquinol methylase